MTKETPTAAAIKQYITDQGLEKALGAAVSQVCNELAPDAVARLGELMLQQAKAAAPKDLHKAVRRMSSAGGAPPGFASGGASKWSKVLEHGLVRRASTLQVEVESRKDAAEEVASMLQDDEGHASDAYVPATLEDAIFVGHLVTDLDSIAGSIGAAHLFGGVAGRASEVNSETKFALQRWGVPTPPPVEELLSSRPASGVCLVDHQQRSQLNGAIKEDRIVGIIDHHALQSQTIVTDKPIYIDIRPWGSMSTIIAHQYMMVGRKPPVGIAGLLLCAILSDTLNLMGPTTTDWDRTMVALLAKITAVDDVQRLASEQFKAKSKQLASLSANQLANGDCKTFGIDGGGGASLQVGFGVIETTDDDVILARRDELLVELRSLRREKQIDVLFLAVVNIVELRSKLLCAGPAEQSLAATAFGGETSHDGTVMDLGALVSRKKEFVPPLTTAVAKEGWQMPTDAAHAAEERESVLMVDPNDPYGRVVRQEKEKA